VPMMNFADCPAHHPCCRSDGGIRRFDEYCRGTSPRLSEWELEIDRQPSDDAIKESRREGEIVDGVQASHTRKPPRKAFSLLPSRVPGGSFLSFLLFPPPSTT
jgi:hypothetical protein